VVAANSFARIRFAEMHPFDDYRFSVIIARAIPGAYGKFTAETQRTLRNLKKPLRSLRLGGENGNFILSTQVSCKS
jgi:hypothetical protein